MDETRLLNLFHTLFSGKHQVTRRLSWVALKKLAAEYGLSVDELGDFAVPNIDVNGVLVASGNYRYRLHIQPDLTVRLQHETIESSQSPIPSTMLRPKPLEMYSILPKVKAIQSNILERAMIDGRRWTRQQFEQDFLAHPIKRYLAQWIVWGAFEGETFLKAFHVTNDLTLADVNYQGVVLPQDTQIGIVHPLHLSEDEHEGWCNLLHDYEIIQPFRQLTRSIYRLSQSQYKVTFEETLTIPQQHFGHENPKMLTQERLGWFFVKDHQTTDFFCKREFPRQDSFSIICLTSVQDHNGYKSHVKNIDFRYQDEIVSASQMNPIIVSETMCFLYRMFQPENFWSTQN